ncbi:hypothetical protein VNI00_017151 [Paramarasmius palmivorus]|uniref:Uncharacterized protein n=1 Tax=Paramarasmius palmivorus TaxID=297713 RepID=A0AAW0B816_9AGAR
MSSSPTHPAQQRAGHSYNSEMTTVADENGALENKTTSVAQSLPRGAAMPTTPTTPQYPPQPPDSPPGTPNQRLLDSHSDAHVQFANYPSEDKRKSWDAPKGKDDRAGKPWIPLPLRPWFWLTFVVILILLAIGLEVALHFSNKNNGFAVRGDPTNNQASVWHYVYTLPPVIVAMFIVAMWTWTDIEIKKMQASLPYVDLVHGDSPPHRSLLLDYTRTNRASSNFVVWIHALSNRHFTVFLASLMLLTSLSFQPLSAALLNVRDTWWSLPDATVNTKTILGLNQNAAFSDLTAFLSSAGFAGATALFNLPQPAFTNGLYTIMQFDMPDVTRNGTSIFVNATAIKTDPGCQPVEPTMVQVGGNGEWNNSVERDGCGLNWTVSRTGPNLFGATAANCTSGEFANVEPQFRPVVFWFFTYQPSARSSATICTPRFQLFDVAVTIDLGSGNVTKVVEQGPLSNFSSQAASLDTLQSRAYNGIDFPANVTDSDSTINSRKQAIQLTMPAAIFQRAVESPEGIEGSFAADRFVGLSTGVYTIYLSLLARDIYFVPAQESITVGIKTTVKRLFLSSVAVHLLAAGLITVSIVACCVHIVHRHERRNLRLRHEPGTIASAVSIGGQTGMGQLLSGLGGGSADEDEMKKMLKSKKFRIDPKTMKIVMEGEDGYEYASTPTQVDLVGRRKSVFEALQRGGRRISVFRGEEGAGLRSPKSPRE